MGDAAAGDDGFHAQGPGQAPVLVVVVAAIPKHCVGASAGPTTLATNRWDGLEQGDEPGDVVAVAVGQSGGKRNAGGVGDQVVLATVPAPVNRASPCFGAPFDARMGEPSTTAREKSRASAPRSLARRVSCSRGQAPASLHSARRRQQVMPDPKPSSCGRKLRRPTRPDRRHGTGTGSSRPRREDHPRATRRVLQGDDRLVRQSGREDNCDLGHRGLRGHPHCHRSRAPRPNSPGRHRVRQGVRVRDAHAGAASQPTTRCCD